MAPAFRGRVGDGWVGGGRVERVEADEAEAGAQRFLGRAEPRGVGVEHVGAGEIDAHEKLSWSAPGNARIAAEIKRLLAMTTGRRYLAGKVEMAAVDVSAPWLEKALCLS